MSADTWVQLLVAGTVLLGSAFTAAMARRTNRETARIQTGPAHREQDREDLRDLRERVDVLEDRHVEHQRLVHALLRYVRLLLRVLRTHDIPPPAPDPGDEPILAGHGIP